MNMRLFQVWRRERPRAESEAIQIGMEAAARAPQYSAPDALWNRIELELDAPMPKPPRRRWPLIIAAAAFAVCAAVAFLWWPRAPRQGWTMVVAEGTGSASKTKLGVGEWLVTGPSERASVAVGDIGEVEVAPNSRVRLVRARPTENRLALDRGEISARIWAPPRLFFVDTPSAVAVDLGCAYTLHVDAQGAGLLRVTLGWVMLEDRGRESMVPAGAACRTRRGFGPGTPYFEDATAAFRQALASFDSGRRDARIRDVLLREARVRDSLTLVHLLARVDASDRAAVYDRLTALAPLPDNVTRAGALAADPAILRQWLDDVAWGW